MSDIIGLVGLPRAIQSIGGPGVATLGGALYTLSEQGIQRSIIDDGSGNLMAAGSLRAGTNASVIATTVITNPPPGDAGTIVTSGVAWQNLTGWDIILRVPVTYSPTSTAASTLAVGVGIANNPAQMTEESVPAGVTAGAVHTTVAYVPAGYYALLTATNATIGAATAYPV